MIYLAALRVLVVAHGIFIVSCGSFTEKAQTLVLAHRLRGAWASVVVERWLTCSKACWNLVSWWGIKPLSSSWQGRVLTTGPPGKSLNFNLKRRSLTMIIHLLLAHFDRYTFKWRPNLSTSTIQVMQQGNYLFILEMDFGSFLSSALLQLSLDGKKKKKQLMFKNCPRWKASGWPRWKSRACEYIIGWKNFWNLSSSMYNAQFLKWIKVWNKL